MADTESMGGGHHDDEDDDDNDDDDVVWILVVLGVQGCDLPVGVTVLTC